MSVLQGSLISPTLIFLNEEKRYWQQAHAWSTPNEAVEWLCWFFRETEQRCLFQHLYLLLSYPQIPVCTQINLWTSASHLHRTHFDISSCICTFFQKAGPLSVTLPFTPSESRSFTFSKGSLSCFLSKVVCIPVSCPIESEARDWLFSICLFTESWLIFQTLF